MNSTSFSCHMCGLTFDSVRGQREHVKSEEHVYKLRCRFSEPGKSISWDSEEPDAKIQPRRRKNLARRVKRREAKDEKTESLNRFPDEKFVNKDEEDKGGREVGDKEEDDDNDDDDDDDEEQSQPVHTFIPEQCLFCNRFSTDFDSNTKHMRNAHSFSIPYSDYLTVDLQTLVWYLQFVIYTYHECICCGKRCSTVQAIQQHMQGKGHRRFDISDEIAEFYNLTSAKGLGSDLDKLLEWTDVNELTLRLPSGKLLSSSSHLNNSCGRPLRSSLFADRTAGGHARENSSTTCPGSSKAGHISASTLLAKRNEENEDCVLQLASLRLGDRQSLAHLSASEQRAALALVRKQQGETEKQIARARGKVEFRGNMTLQTHYTSTSHASKFWSATKTRMK